MRIEGRGLEHFRECQLHLVSQGCEVGRGNLAIFVLDEMQIFDQEIAPPRPVAEQQFDFMRGHRIDLAPLGGRFGPPASLARMFERADLLHVMTHQTSIPSAWINSKGWYARCQQEICRSPNDLRGLTATAVTPLPRLIHPLSD
jgi:hypothetical protein